MQLMSNKAVMAEVQMKVLSTVVMQFGLYMIVGFPLHIIHIYILSCFSLRPRQAKL